MVTVKEPSDYDKLEAIITKACHKFELKLYVTGWTRKTFDIFRENRKMKKSEHIARVESLAVTNGEVRYFDDRYGDFARELGEAIESTFALKEAILIFEKRPEY